MLNPLYGAPPNAQQREFTGGYLKILEKLLTLLDCLPQVIAKAKYPLPVVQPLMETVVVGLQSFAFGGERSQPHLVKLFLLRKLLCEVVGYPPALRLNITFLPLNPVPLNKVHADWFP